jgi:hypothetical protein
MSVSRAHCSFATIGEDGVDNRLVSNISAIVRGA